MSEIEDSALDLTARAYQFIGESLRNAQRSSDEGHHLWVFAISNIAQGLELLLKERLRREHSILVFADIEKNRPNTVSFTQALQRLARCGVKLADEDLERIYRARELRNSLVHYVPNASADQLKAAFVDFFEFVHVFHLEQLSSELHPHLPEDLWQIEADLIGQFRREYVNFQGVTVVTHWPSELVEAQLYPTFLVDGVALSRIPFGHEQDLPEGFVAASIGNCHDCAARFGQFHGPGCDMERCPNCDRQFLSCDCEGEWTGEMQP